MKFSRARGALAVLTLASLAGLGPAPAAGGELRNVRVTTDGSLDWSSPEAIVAGTFKGRTDEEKVLHFWNCFRRVEWHYMVWPDSRNLTGNLLSTGQNLCGSQAALQLVIFKQAGYQARPVFVMGGGHTFIEVFYGERWHALDAMTGFYVYSRTDPRYIVSLEEIKADPALVTAAEAEKRAPEVLFACAREPEIPKKKTLPWSHYKPLPEMIKYYAEGAQSAKIGGAGDLYGGAFTAGKMNVSLRAGESFTRTWDFEPGKYPAGWAYPEDAETGPFHRCGHNDEFDKANFPYWEPYLKENVFVYKRQGAGAEPVNIKRCYRYFANGRFDRKLSAAELLAAASSKSGVKLDGDALAPAGPAAGSVELVTGFPYFICDGDVKIAYSRPAAADELALYVLEKNQPRKVWSASKTGEAAESAALGRFDVANLDLHKYTLRLSLSGGAKVKSMEISTVIMHNMFAGPHLVPGKNKVTITVDNPEELASQKLFVIYKYADGEGWKDEHTVEKAVEKSPTEFEIEVKGPKHPRMKSVRLEVRPGLPGSTDI